MESRQTHEALLDTWIVSRELCVFEQFDLGLVPRQKRRFALEKQVRAISPFKEYESFVKWKDGHASVWLWDRQKKESQRVAFSTSHNLIALPESALVDPLEEGVGAFKGLDGFFMQVWRRGILFAETSWPYEPSLEEQNWFLRSNERSTEEIDTCTPAQWAPIKYIPGIRQQIAQRVDLVNTAITFFLTGLVSLALSYQLFGFIFLSYHQNAVSESINVLKDEKSEVVSVRSRTLEIVDYTDKLKTEIRPKQMNVISRVATSLKEERNNLVEWKFEGHRIEAIFLNAENSNDVIVERLEATELFESISLDLDPIRGRITINLELIHEP